MSTLKAHNIEPATGSDVALGAAGDSVTVSGDSLKLDTFKDAGGNTLFTSDGSGTLSSVNSGLKGAGPVLIQSQTASNSASISFTSGLDSTYDKYIFVFLNINPATDRAHFTFQVNSTNDAGGGYDTSLITSTFFFAYQKETDANDYNLAYLTDFDQAQAAGFQTVAHDVGSGSDESAAGIMHLFSPASTTYVKHFYSRLQVYHGLDYSQDQYAAGYINDASYAIDDIRFKMSSGNFDGKIKMYGIG